jgi:hypothetical protein
VREWAQGAGFEIIKDANGEIWYYHILARRVSSPRGWQTAPNKAKSKADCGCQNRSVPTTF